MNSQPLTLSILLGIILLLIIGGVSLSVKLSNSSKEGSACLSERMELLKLRQQLEQEKESLTAENTDLRKKLDEMQSQYEASVSENEQCSLELQRTLKIKEALEERLKDELLKQDSSRR